MPIVGKFFPSQKSQEKVFLLLRRHWFTYLGFVLVGLIMSIPVLSLIIYSISNPETYTGPIGNIIIICLFAYMLLVVAVMLYGFIDYYLDVYIVTNERIVNIEQNGFFKREISELHLHQIQDVSAKVIGMLPTMMHYGDIHIQTAGERENFIFKSIPNPYRVSKLIVDLHEAQLEERDKEQDSENQAMDDYDQDSKTKIRDQLDLESVDPAALSVARKRTKEFLKSGQIEETELKLQVEQELENQHYEKLLDKIKTTTEYDPPKKSSTGQQPNSEDLPKPVKGGDEGEMKENQEVDF